MQVQSWDRARISPTANAKERVVTGHGGAVQQL